MTGNIVELDYGVKVETPHMGTILLGFEKSYDSSGFVFYLVRLRDVSGKVAYIRAGPGENFRFNNVFPNVPPVIDWEGKKYPLEEAVETLYELGLDANATINPIEQQEIQAQCDALEREVVKRILKTLISERQVAAEFVA